MVDSKILAITNGNSKCDARLKKKNIKIINNVGLDKIDLYNEQGYEIHIYDNLARYYYLGSLGYNVKYIPLFSIDVYSNDENFEEMLNTLDKYCLSHEIVANIYKDTDPLAIKTRAQKEISSKFILIFTKQPELYKDLQDELSDKKIFINENPFIQ